MAFASNFTSCGLFDSSPATEWWHVDNFDDQYVTTCYWFASTTKGNGGVQWNNAMAINLLIDKCNALQAEVDALGTPAEVNMETIIGAMIQAEFYEIEQFVGLVDAYRTTIMNEPFDVHFYETLVGLFRR